MVEWPYQIISGIVEYATFYYPVEGIHSPERQGLVLVLCIVFFVYPSTCAQLVIAALAGGQIAGSIA